MYACMYFYFLFFISYVKSSSNSIKRVKIDPGRTVDVRFRFARGTEVRRKGRTRTGTTRGSVSVPQTYWGRERCQPNRRLGRGRRQVSEFVYQNGRSLRPPTTPHSAPKGKENTDRVGSTHPASPSDCSRPHGKRCPNSSTSHRTWTLSTKLTRISSTGSSRRINFPPSGASTSGLPSNCGHYTVGSFSSMVGEFRKNPTTPSLLVNQGTMKNSGSNHRKGSSHSTERPRHRRVRINWVRPGLRDFREHRQVISYCINRSSRVH